MASGDIIQRGEMIDITLGGTVTKGDVFEGTGAIGVYMDSGVSGDTVPVFIGPGVVELTKETGVVFTQGDLLFWDAANNRLDKTVTNIFAGIAANDVASGVLLARVHLNMGSTLVA